MIGTIGKLLRVLPVDKVQDLILHLTLFSNTKILMVRWKSILNILTKIIYLKTDWTYLKEKIHVYLQLYYSKVQLWEMILFKHTKELIQELSLIQLTLLIIQI